MKKRLKIIWLSWYYVFSTSTSKPFHHHTSFSHHALQCAPLKVTWVWVEGISISFRFFLPYSPYLRTYWHFSSQLSLSCDWGPINFANHCNLIIFNDHRKISADCVAHYSEKVKILFFLCFFRPYVNSTKQQMFSRSYVRHFSAQFNPVVCPSPQILCHGGALPCTFNSHRWVSPYISYYSSPWRISFDWASSAASLMELVEVLLEVEPGVTLTIVDVGLRQEEEARWRSLRLMTSARP